MTRKPTLNIPHPSDKRIYVGDTNYVQLEGFSCTEDRVLDVMALRPTEGKATDRWRQALFLRMFEEQKFGPLYFPELWFQVQAPRAAKDRWFQARSLAKWEQGEGRYAGPISGFDPKVQQETFSHTLIVAEGFDQDFAVFQVLAPLYTWLRWLYARKHDVNNELDPYANAVEQFVAEQFPNVYAAWLEHTEGVYLTKEETEELTGLLAGKVVSPRLYHKITGERL